MENIGGPQVYQVIDANMVEDLKQIYNLDNVQLVMSGGDDVYGQQVIQMQAPNQPELVVNESPQSSQQRAPQQIVYHSPDPAQTQTFVLQQTPERHIQQQVVMQRTPVNEERVTEQQVFYTELQTPQEQAQAALNQQVINAQQNHIQQQSPPQVIISSQPQSQLQFVTTNRPQETQQSSQPMTIIQQQPNQQYFLHTGSAPQQFYIQQEPNTQYTRVLYDSRMPQMQPRATLLIQEPPRIMQQPPTLRHVIQQQPQGQQVQLSQPTVQRIVPIRTSSPSKIIQAPFWPNNPGLIQTRARIVRPRVPRPSPAPGALGIVRTVSTPRARIVTSAGQQHPPPQNVRLSYVTTPTRQVAPPRMTLNRTVSPQNRVVLQTRPRAAMQSPARLPTTSPNPIMTIKKSPAPAKGASEDPDDIESNITAAIVSRKPDGTPILEPSPGPMEVKRVAVPRQPQAVKKLPVMGGQTPIIPAQLLAKQEEEPKERESAKMLVILQSGEQRLITFTLPKECCTVQELLEQVGVPFSADSNIQCISNPGADIDYVVTVGVTADTNELMVVTESTLKSPLTQPQPTQVQLQMQTTPPQMPPAPPNSTRSHPTSPTSPSPSS